MLHGPKFNLAKENIIPLIQELAIMFILSSISTCSAADPLNLIVHKGENFSFDCCKNPSSVIKSFIVHNPNGDIHNAVQGHPFVNKKVTATISEACEVDIKEAGLKDNGVWKCDVFVHDENSKSISVTHRYINVALSEPQEQESDRTLAILLSIFGVGLVIVIVACYVCIPCHGQNNNGSDNNSQEATATHMVNVLNNNGREGNSHEVTASVTGNYQGNNSMDTNSPDSIIPIGGNSQDNIRTESSSPEGPAQNIRNLHDNTSSVMASLESTPPKINIIPKTSKNQTYAYYNGNVNGRLGGSLIAD